MSEQKFGLFDYVKDLTQDKKQIKKDDPDFERNYNPFMIGRALSFNVSDVLWVNVLNMYHDSMTKQMHHDFLYNGLKKSRRSGRWIKDKKEDHLMPVAEYFSISLKEAEGLMDLISEEELERILIAKGGKIKK